MLRAGISKYRAFTSNVRESWRTFAAAYPKTKWVLSSMAWLPMGIVFTQLFYTVKIVSGRSMQPTLNPDSSKWRDLVVFDKFSVKALHRYERGDVVALRSPSDFKLIVKRIIALPGDTVKTLPPYPDATVCIPEGHAWVEGDEPFHSEDSNYFGPIPLGLIDSKLSFVVWPLLRIGSLQKPQKPDPKTMRGPGWRRDMDDFEREQRRRARVTVAS